MAVLTFLLWVGIATSKWHSWKGRYGKANEHNAWVPRDHWLEDAEKQAILDFHARFPLEGYRRLTFMMLDADVVACSPASVYRVLSAAGVLGRHNTKPSAKGTGFVQPLQPHEHWHVDVAYLNIAGTFYHLCSILDGCGRYIAHREIRATMTEADVEQIVQRARERSPGVTPRIISDNGPQFIAKDFKAFIRICGMTHVKTSSYYGQAYDVVVRFPDGRQIPPYLYRAIATAIRDESIEDDAIYSVHFMGYHAPVGYYTRKIDRPHIPAPGLNNCFFPSDSVRLHDRLRFRSRGEVAIYEELKKHAVLFFPNTAAVLGQTDMKKEPDFLICSGGKWGILEVNGDAFHTAQNATKDHDRGRLFKQLGVLCIEFYDADRCLSDPAGVVRDFLAILARH
jgi:hypothetical protein